MSDKFKIEIEAELSKEKLQKDLEELKRKKHKISVDVDNEGVESTSKSVKHLGTTTVATNNIFGKLKNTISNTFSAGKIAMTGYLMVLNEINKASKNAKQAIKEIDNAITDLSIATNQSRESVSALVKDYNDYAKELKSTTSQITSASNDYLRAGKSMSEAQTLIKDSIMLSKLGKLDSGEATKDLLATMNGYSMSVDEVNKALDAMVAVDMEASTSAGDIATALKYCASSADAAGVSFNKLTGMIAQTQDKTMQSAETIGTFYNTLLSRYRDVKIGNYLTEDSEDISDYESVLKSVNVQLRDAEGEFRNFEVVLDELSEVWSSLSSTQQAAVIKVASGTRQQNRFIALMEGYAKALELTEVAANSAGTAVEKFNNSYVNSLEAKENTLQASFESMIINSDFDEVYSGIIEATTALVDFINQTNALKGVLTGLTVAGGIKGFLAIKTGINEAYITLNKFQNAMNIVGKTEVSTKEFEQLLLLSNGLSTSQMKLVLSTNALSVSQKKELLIASGLSEKEAALQLQTWKMTAANTGLTVSTTTLGNAFKGLWSTLMANPLILVTTLISGAVMAYQSYNQKLEETRQSNIENSKSIIEQSKNISDLYSEYMRLSSIQTKTSSEEEAFKQVIEDVTKALGDKAEILAGLTAGTDEYADALARATKEELQSQAVTATIGRKSAEEEFQNNIWSDWSGSKVSIDSNSGGKTLSNEAEEAVNIVSDALKEYETVNRTWNNISWDISSDDPVKALEYYNALVKAREDLVMASEKDEALLDTEIYSDLNNAINSMSESLSTYIDLRYQEEKLNYMAQNGVPDTTEEYQAMESALVSVAGSSVDLQDRFKELLMSDFSDLATDISNVGNVVKDVEGQIESISTTLSISQTIDQLNTRLKPAMDSIKSAWQDIFSGDNGEMHLNEVDLLSVADNIKSKLDELSDPDGLNLKVDYTAYENLIRILEDTESTEDDVKQGFNGLAQSIINAGVSGTEDFETLKDSLEDLGVINNEVVAFESLANNTEALKEAGLDLANATDEQIASFANEMVSAENVSTAIAILTFQKQLCGLQDMNTAGEVANLKTLAENAGYTGEVIQYLTELEQIYQNVASGVYGTNNQQVAMAMERARQLQTLITESATKVQYKPEVDFSGVTKSAKSAGKEAGKSYKDALKEELNDLDSVISGITGRIDDQISSINSQKSAALAAIDAEKEALESAKDAAVEALEEERQKRLDVIEAQRKQIQDNIDAKQKIIDGINKEIQAMRDANSQRQREIELGEAKYQLEKIQNQKTKLVYSSDKGMHYESDTKGVFDAKEQVRQVKLEIEIANKEKQIDLIETEIDKLNEQLDLLDEQENQVNEHYDQLIKQTEKFYDQQIKALETQRKQTELYFESIIKNLENSKSKFQELTEILEKAELSAKLKQLGIDEEALLNGSEEEFNKLKNAYMNIVTQLNAGNDEVLSSLQELSGYNGTAPAVLSDTTEKLGEMNTQLKSSTEGMDKLNTSASTASTNTSAISSNLEEMKISSDGLPENLNDISDALTNLPEAEKFDAIAKAFTDLGEAIKDVATALGVGEEGTVGGLVQALEQISSTSLDGASSGGENAGTGAEGGKGSGGGGGGIISQFNNLKTAVEGVTSAISGGSGSGGDASASSSPSMSSGSGSGGSSGGLIGAIDEFKSATDEALGGGGGESGSEGGGEKGSKSEGGGSGAIPQFEQLKTAVDDVTTSIGTGEEEGGSEGEDSSTLTGAIIALGETTQETLGESGGEGVIGRFEEFKDVIGEANEHVTGISEGLAAIDGQEVECTIKINIETTGGIPKFASGTVLAGMNLSSAEYKAKYGSAHVTGTANVTGNWGVRESGRSLVGELGQEIWVHSKNGTFETVGDHGAEFINTEKGDLIFNHLQTKELLSKGNLVGRGKAYANGTDNAEGWFTLPDGTELRPLQPGDKEWDLMQKFNTYLESIDNNVEKLIPNAFYEQNRQIQDIAKQINNSNITNNRNIQPSISVGDIYVTCPGVTSKEVAQQVGAELNNMFSGLHLDAYQRVNRR